MGELTLRQREEGDRARVEAFLAERCSARLKPEIPRTGEYGIEFRDELELEKVLGT